MISLCVYTIYNSTFYFSLCKIFSLCKHKGNFEVSDPPYSLGGVRFIFNTSACTHGHLYLSVMHVFVFLCVLWFALLLSVNFCKHERKLQNLVEKTCCYPIRLPFIKAGSFSFIFYYDDMCTYVFSMFTDV